jgi:hypothetical protein
MRKFIKNITNREWAKHLRPWGKRAANKKSRQILKKINN